MVTNKNHQFFLVIRVLESLINTPRRFSEVTPRYKSLATFVTFASLQTTRLKTVHWSWGRLETRKITPRKTNDWNLNMHPSEKGEHLQPFQTTNITASIYSFSRADRRWDSFWWMSKIRKRKNSLKPNIIHSSMILVCFCLHVGMYVDWFFNKGPLLCDVPMFITPGWICGCMGINPLLPSDVGNPQPSCLGVVNHISRD